MDTDREMRPTRVVVGLSGASGAIYGVGVYLALRQPHLQVIFFMDSPKLVEQFRAIHTRVTSEPDRPITPEELATIEERLGGGRAVN